MELYPHSTTHFVFMVPCLIRYRDSLCFASCWDEVCVLNWKGCGSEPAHCVALQVIADLKGSESSWSFQTPPSSPSSLGSRKSSMCSISSLNSSSSGSTKSHHSPNHQYWHRSLSQVRCVLQFAMMSLPSRPQCKPHISLYVVFGVALRIAVYTMII